MRTFAELLREYTGRTGVSDAELARAVGVQRQTIFRWKEGTVARPRSADEVLRAAAKLRLTPGERDELLLAAGFPPVAAVAPPQPATAVEPDAAPGRAVTSETGPEPPTPDGVGVAAEQDRPVPLRPHGRRRLGWTMGALAAALLLAAAVLFGVPQEPAYPHAAPGERLVVLAQFGNYTGGAQGYNVAGRLSEALERELTAAGLRDVRLALWPAAVTDEPAAARAQAQRRGAVHLGRVRQRTGRRAFLLPEELAAEPREISLQAGTPAELPAVINSTLPGDIRYLALYSLAQIYLHQDDPPAAHAALARAALHLPADTLTRATHHFLWGFANQTMQPPDLDAAIRATPRPYNSTMDWRRRTTTEGWHT